MWSACQLRTSSTREDRTYSPFPFRKNEISFEYLHFRDSTRKAALSSNVSVMLCFRRLAISSTAGTTIALATSQNLNPLKPLEFVASSTAAALKHCRLQQSKEFMPAGPTPAGISSLTAYPKVYNLTDEDILLHKSHSSSAASRLIPPRDFCSRPSERWTAVGTCNSAAIVNCSSNDDQSSSPNGDKKNELPPKELLDQVADRLSWDMAHFFVRQPDFSLYREDIVFDNRMSGRTTVGAYNYIKQMHFLRIWGHLRFVFVRFGIMKVTVHPLEGQIQMRWQISGIGMIKMLLMYLPKQLWKQENVAKNATIYLDGMSTFYVDGNGLIYRHVADNKMPSKSDVVVKIKEKLEKLKPQTNPAL